MNESNGSKENDISEAEFPQAVLERSKERPVVVDFWAPWCGPCRVLGPVLEKEVEALEGRVAMVKVNTDQAPRLAADFNIQGIPAVKAFRNGEVVAEFVGARPAAFIRTWLAALAPSPMAEALNRAEAAAAEGRRDEALALVRPLVETPEIRDAANLLLARLLVEGGRPEDAQAAREALTRIDPRSEVAEKVPAVERFLGFAEDAHRYGGEEAALRALAKDPTDLEAKYALASARAASGDFAGALEEFLEIVSRDRKFKDDEARRAMLALFEHLGHDHDLTRDFRRRLQIIL